jgi:hypothetical protein
MDDVSELRLWYWTVTDPITKRRRQTTYLMTEEDARARFGDDARKVERSLEVRTDVGSTSSWERSAR